MATAHAYSPRLRRAVGSALVLAGFALPLALSSTPAEAAKVQGRAIGKLLNPVWNEARDPKARRYTFREPSPTVRSDVWVLTSHLPRELAIVAFGEGAPVDKNPLKVQIMGGRTSLVTIVVPEGRAIQFENTDPFKHRLYEVSGKGRLAESEIGERGTTTWTPPGPGKYEIRDKLVPSLRTWVVVEKGVYAVTYPDRKGEFGIELPPGQYKLRAFHAGEAVGPEVALDVKPAPATQPLKDPLKVGEVPPPAPSGSTPTP